MMHPKLRWVMLTAAFGFLACHGDPTDSLRNGVDHLTASPTDITINNGDSVAVTVQAVDEQGNVIESDFTGSSADPLIDFKRDDGFLPVYNDQNQLVPPTSPSRARFFVKALGVVASTVTVSAGGVSRDLRVVTLPTVFGGVYATAPSNVGLLDTVTVTPPAGLSFDVSVTPTITGAPADPLVLDFTASSLSFVPAGGTNGPLTVGVLLDYAGPGVAATLTDTTVINKPSTGAAAGAFATAPPITLPASGSSYVVYDDTPFNSTPDCLNSEGVACKLYRLDLAAPATFDLNATWFNGAVGQTTDLGVYWVDAGGNDVGSFGCDSHGNDGAPETCTVSLPAGTFYMAMVTFAPFYDPPDDVDPPAFQIQVIAP
jgi:hypothetical protein